MRCRFLALGSGFRSLAEGTPGKPVVMPSRNSDTAAFRSVRSSSLSYCDGSFCVGLYLRECLSQSARTDSDPWAIVIATQLKLMIGPCLE